MTDKPSFADLPESIQAAIGSLVNYNLDAKEIEDYVENYPGSKGHHVLESAVTVRNWMLGTQFTPEQVAEINVADYIDDESIEGRYFRVEFDPGYYGGDYRGTGSFALIPASLVKKVNSVESAFLKHTGFDPQHIIHYSLDERYDKNGDRVD
jgi:hypothetical protein